MPRISVIHYSEAAGKLKEIYDGLIKSRGKLADVHMIQSLRPESITAHMDLYMEIMYSRSELSRAERELMGTVVSITNGCKYCTKHHAEALDHYWKDKNKIAKLLSEEYSQILSEKENTLCEFAKHLTLNPEQHENHDHTQKLKKAGLSDAAVLDAVLVTAYFNFVNRIVLSLGVRSEIDEGTGYQY
ncbi:MAG: peroxidase-related enzyme [Candidatus Marinimicrobia bacterium]|nr:peroxidase-related enzyme [Candidatus Neomarinimicrobiota bacterium]